ncbi:MAG TPA: sodium:proton antiporter [Steroidobacteraceae bacterium]|nr:sodium:proton antiporter [Steroidobacteraceae bacterium]
MDIAAIFLVATALLAYVNHRFIGLPSTIGVMGIALMLSVALALLDAMGVPLLRQYELRLLSSFNFTDVLMQGMLSLLLFAGALHVDLSELRAFKWQIGVLALFATTASAILIGICTWFILPLFELQLPLAYCFVFGALISPTDPVAVLGILKSARVPKSLELVITGESLFNDGVGVVLFAVAISMVGTGTEPSISDALVLLLREAGGGIAFGLLIGWVAFALLRTIDSYQEEILLTLATVVGGYALANHLHVSGPLAMVVVGLVIGNQGRAFAMSETTRENLDVFWELLDAILNSVLFVLIGLEVVVTKFSHQLVLPAALVLIATLCARWITVGIPAGLFKRSFGLPDGSWRVVAWGGLRGGISVALALSLRPGDARDLLVSLTYVIVVFSILVQGLTIGGLARRVARKHPPAAPQ